ncbi:YpiB family protein [Bacillus sp. FJAT-45350]|uniref:YpiB family protein n=1 Tax=Bacillus sp. FJAT-45350 TaxID=2011014 RepID=UPI0015CAFF19|nr:YpiB family protein [Bacillus sp. FJAT-45350]
MKNWVSTSQKKSFIKWFLDNHRLKRTEARYLLEYLVKSHHILENLKFTDEVLKDKTTVVISSTSSDQIGFMFYKSNRKSEDVSRAIGEIMSNPSDDLYIVFHFYGRHMNNRYLSLFEDPLIENIRRYNLTEKYSKVAESKLEESLEANKGERLKRQIDRALDEKDEALFKSLVAELRAYEEQQF